MTEIEKALQLNSETEIILKIGEIIWSKLESGDESFSNLTEVERVFIYVDMLEGEVNNGGFDQFFFNHPGNYTEEILTAYKKIKAYKTVELIEKAIAFFPILPIPKDIVLRRQVMQDIGETISKEWNNLDNKFYQYEENIAKLLIDYIKENANSVSA